MRPHQLQRLYQLNKEQKNPELTDNKTVIQLQYGRRIGNIRHIDNIPYSNTFKHQIIYNNYLRPAGPY